MGLNYTDLLYCNRAQLWDTNLMSGFFEFISQWQLNHLGLYADPFRENCVGTFLY